MLEFSEECLRARTFPGDFHFLHSYLGEGSWATSVREPTVSSLRPFCHGYCSKCIFLSSSHSLLCRLFTPSETVSTVDGLLAAEMPTLVSPFYPAGKWLITNISSAPWLTLAYPLRLLFLLWDTVSIRNSSMAHCSQASSVYVSFDFSYKSFSAS